MHWHRPGFPAGCIRTFLLPFDYAQGRFLFEDIIVANCQPSALCTILRASSDTSTGWKYTQAEPLEIHERSRSTRAAWMLRHPYNGIIPGSLPLFKLGSPRYGVKQRHNAIIWCSSLCSYPLYHQAKCSLRHDHVYEQYAPNQRRLAFAHFNYAIPARSIRRRIINHG